MQPHLFVLDDEPAVTLAIFYLAQGAGWRVSTANNSKDALDLLSKNGADVFLTDYRMPECNGLKVIEILQKSHPTMSMILMSGFPGEIDHEHAKELGVATILEKPFGCDLLFQTLNQALSLKASAL